MSARGAEDRPAAGTPLAVWAIMALFFVQAFGLANWYPRIADVQLRLELSPGVLAICILGMSLGSLFTTLLAGPLIDRTSPKRVMFVGLFVFYGALVLLGFAWNAPSLFVMLVLLGTGFVTVDVATNVEAARVQEALGRRIISTGHGIWSLGAFGGSVIGGFFSQGAVPVAVHLGIAAAICLPAGFVIVRMLPAGPPHTAAAGGARRPRVALPTFAMLGLCLFAFGSILVEISTRNWSVIFMREVLGASPTVAGFGLGAFSLMMAVGRLFGDRMADRFGPVRVGRTGASIAVVGLLLLVFANGIPMAIIGLTAIGVGISIGFPLSVGAAAVFGGRAPALNVASLSLVAYSGSLVGPPLIGFVTEFGGLRMGFAALLPLMLIAGWFASALGRGNRKTDAG